MLSNDSFCSGTLGTTAVTITLISSPIVGATISNTGIITIPIGIPVGTYTFTYKFCLVSAPSSCSTTGSIIIKLTGNLVAVNDNFSASPINSPYGGFTSSVLSNDILNNIPVVSTNILITLNSVTPSSASGYITINNLGIINVMGGLPIGTYAVNYCISQINCSTNSSCGVATIASSDLIITPTAIPGIRADNLVELVDTQTDNKIIISGFFNNFNNVYNNGIVRLKDDLTLDTNPLNITPPSGFSLHNTIYSPDDMKVIKNMGVNLNKILLVGTFTAFNGSSIQGVGIVRLMPNGDIDPTFNTGAIPVGAIRGFSGANKQARTIYIYPDNALNGNAGKMLIGGSFSAYNGYASNKLVRLNTDGSLDTAFSNNINFMNSYTQGTIMKGFTSTPQAIDVQSNGKIIIGGYFNFFSGLRKSRILRLFNDGTIDNSFVGYIGTSQNADIDTPTLEIPGLIQKLIVDENDNIIVAGYFSKCNNITRNSIARFLPNGDLDLNFNPGAGFFPGHIPGIPYQEDGVGLIRSLVYERAVSTTAGKLYVSGGFTKYNNLDVPKVIRLNCAITGVTGSRDTNFKMDPNGSTTVGGPNNNVWCMKKQGSKLLLAGEFTKYNIFNSLRITRILPVNSGPSSEAKGSSFTYYESEPEIDSFNNTKDEFTIYPNPNNGKFLINSNKNIDKIDSVLMYNTIGEKIYEKNNFILDNYQLDLTNLIKGTYFIVISNDKSTTTKTVVIK